MKNTPAKTLSPGTPQPAWRRDGAALLIGSAFSVAWLAALLFTAYNPNVIVFFKWFAVLVIAPLTMLDLGVLGFYWMRKKKMAGIAKLAVLLPLGLTIAAILAADGL